MEIPKNKRVRVALCIAFWYAAQFNITPGYFLSNFINQYNLVGVEQGWISTVYTFGTMACLLAMMTFFSHLDQKKILYFAILLLILIGILFAQVPPLPLLIAGYFIAGIGFGIVNTTTSALMVQASSPNRIPAAMGLLHGVFGFGGLSMPMLFTALESVGVVWNKLFYVIGFNGIASITLYFWLCRDMESLYKKRITPTIDKKRWFTWDAVSQFLRKPGIVQMLLCSLCYGAHQEAIILWVKRYMQFTFGLETLAGLTLSLFWVGTSIARIGIFMIQIEPSKIIRIGNLISFLVLISGLFIKNGICMAFCVFLVGLLGGATHPLLIAMAAEREKVNGLVSSSGILFTAYVGHFVSPLIIGAIVLLVGVWASMMVAALAVLGTSLFTKTFE